MFTYKSKAHPDVQAFVLHIIDGCPISTIADHLQMPPDQAEAAVAREYAKRLREGTLPMSAKKKPIGHDVIAVEDRVCGDHGQYVAQQWRLIRTVGGDDVGAIPAWLKPFWGNCPQCDRLMQAEVDRFDAEARQGSNSKAEARKMGLVGAGVPDRYLGVTMFNWLHSMDQQNRVWRWAMDFCTNFEDALRSGRSAVFTGAPGTGKTRLAISVLAHIIEKGGTGLYTTAMAMMGRIKDTYNAKATETEREVINIFQTVDLLVIDEVGKQIDTQYDQSQLFRILDNRYQYMKPTILVSNLTRAGIEQFLTAPVCDRIREYGGQIMMFDWASQRHSKPPEQS